MGVASPLQSGKPMEYWLDGLLTKELVHLWEFLSRNLDKPHNHASGCQAALDCCDYEYYGVVDLPQEDLPTAKEVRKHIYSETMPSSFYACKDRGDPPRILPPQKGE